MHAHATAAPSAAPAAAGKNHYGYGRGYQGQEDVPDEAVSRKRHFVDAFVLARELSNRETSWLVADPDVV